MLTLRIRVTGETRKELERVLGRAFRAGDLALVRRGTVLLAIARGEPGAGAAASGGVSRATGYAWLRGFLADGVVGLRVQWRGGRPAKLTAGPRGGRGGPLPPRGPAGGGPPAGAAGGHPHRRARGGRVPDRVLARPADPTGDRAGVRGGVQRPLPSAVAR